MDNLELPFGSQFSPNVINLRDLLLIAKDNEGISIGDYSKIVAKKYWPTSSSAKKLAGNTKIALSSYGLLSDGDIHLTEVGENLLAIEDDELMHKAFAKHILLDLNGLVFVETLRRMYLNGDPLTNESVNIALIKQGFHLQQTSNNAQVMKLWLEKANIVNGWKINENALKELLGMESSEIAIFKELTPEQYFFLLALCNASSASPLLATDVRNLASASYNIDFGEKAFASRVIKPLKDKNLINAEKTTDGRGAKSSLVQLTDKTKREVVEPLLSQFKSQVGNALADAYCKSFAELKSEIGSSNTYVKGLALEAFAIKIMHIIGLDFLKTRYRDIQIGGAEVDVLFDSTRLMYSRWQVQCKNTATVSIDMVAKEVGLSHMLKSNVIVMMTTGHLTAEARKYARRIMEDMNLCILILEAEDIDSIIKNPPAIVDIFNRQSEEIKKVKILHDGDSQ